MTPAAGLPVGVTFPPGVRARVDEACTQMLDGSSVLVAFSGGADSTALAVLLADRGSKVVLGHVDHGLRSESDAECELCRGIARGLGLEFLSRRVTVEPATQAEARRRRYEALGEMAQSCGAGQIATGHTMDDQAETVALRLQRGGYGLGIPPVRGRIVRPLLAIRRAETEQVCRTAGIEFLSDPSNTNLRYRRVQIRGQLASAGDAAVRDLLRRGEHAAEVCRAVNVAVDRVWETAVLEDSAGQVRIDSAVLDALDDPVRRQLLHRAAARIGIELSRSAAQLLASRSPGGARVGASLPGGISAWTEYGTLILGHRPQPGGLPGYPLIIGSTVRLPEWHLEMEVSRIDLPAPYDRSRRSEVIDARAAQEGLMVRQWRPGDRFRPLGGPGTKKLQDFFVDAKVPKYRRLEVPVVCSGDRIVWVGGHRLDDRARLRPDSSAALRITMKPTSDNGRTAWPE